CNRCRRRNRGRCCRRPCFWCGRRLRPGFLRRQTSGQGEQDRKNDGKTNHRRVKHEKVALSIDHEIDFREPDSGTFPRLRRGERSTLYISSPHGSEPKRYGRLLQLGSRIVFRKTGRDRAHATLVRTRRGRLLSILGWRWKLRRAL